MLILQKRAIRLICNFQPLSHCATLDKQCSILFVFDLYKYHILKYMHNVFHNLISFDPNLFRSVINVHLHRTRSANYNYFVFPVSTAIRKNFVAHTGVIMWNKLPNNIKLSMHFSFVRYLRNLILSEYDYLLSFVINHLFI